MNSSKFYNLFLLLGFILWMNHHHACAQSLLPVNYNQSNTAILYNPSMWNTDILKYPFLPNHSLGVQFRKQWIGVNAAPQNYFLGYDMMKPKNVIFGLGILNEGFGPYNTFSFSTRVAYRKFINSKSFFSLGFQGSFGSQKYDPTDFNIAQLQDQIIGINESNTNLSIGAGLSFSNNISTKSNLTLGLALMNAATINLGRNLN